MKIGVLQFKPKLGYLDDNLARIETLLSGRKFDLMVLPELATTGYSFASRKELKSVAENKQGLSFAFFEDISVRTGGAIVWGMAEACGSKIYNSAVLTTPEGDHHIYRKTHLFFREKLIFDPGNTGFRVFNWRGIRIGLMICFDWIFPEAARTLALKGSQVICHPANLVLPYCQGAMITRSIENRVFCVTANRVGGEDIAGHRIVFTGRSQIVDPAGQRLFHLGYSEETVRIVKINPKLSDTKQVGGLNDIFADRRRTLYKL